MTFPNGVVATDVPVHPTPLYEAVAALVIAGLLWWLGRRTSGAALFGWYLVLSGAARFLVEFPRTNTPVALGLTQPQLWALASVAGGTALLAWAARRTVHAGGQPPGASPALSESPATHLDRTGATR